MRRNLIYLLFILFWMIVDQATKWIIVQKVSLHSVVNVIPGFVNITHIRNKGAIFGFFSRTDNQLVFAGLTFASLVALAMVVYYFFKTAPSEKLMKFSLSLILAGALGNLFDRVIRGYVIDFLDFYIQRWHWPTFNVADSCISVGAFLLIIGVLFRRKTACCPFS